MVAREVWASRFALPDVLSIVKPYPSSNGAIQTGVATGWPDLRNETNETYLALSISGLWAWGVIAISELFLNYFVGEGGLEPPASWSQTRHATNCATPRTLVILAMRTSDATRAKSQLAAIVKHRRC